MRHAQVKVYKFSELSADAKERAKSDHAAALGYAWDDEAIDSLKALAVHFGGKVSDYEIDFWQTRPSHASFDMPELDEADIRAKLAELGSYDQKTLKGHGDCKLTGYCADEDAIDGFRAAFRKGESDLTALMDEAFDSWLKAAQADCEYQYSDEAFAEHCEANNYEFDESGEMV